MKRGHIVGNVQLFDGISPESIEAMINCFKP